MPVDGVSKSQTQRQAEARDLRAEKRRATEDANREQKRQVQDDYDRARAREAREEQRAEDRASNDIDTTA